MSKLPKWRSAASQLARLAAAHEHIRRFHSIGRAAASRLCSRYRAQLESFLPVIWIPQLGARRRRALARC